MNEENQDLTTEENSLTGQEVIGDTNAEEPELNDNGVPMKALYKVCYGNEPRGLEHHVNILINKGWQPLGGVGIGDMNKTKCFVQAMVALVPVPEEELEKRAEEEAASESESE